MSDDDTDGAQFVAVDRIVGLAEVSQVIGEQRTTISNWMRRNNPWNFPQPIKHLECGPLWDIDDVLAWLVSNNLPSAEVRRSGGRYRQKS